MENKTLEELNTQEYLKDSIKKEMDKKSSKTILNSLGIEVL